MLVLKRKEGQWIEVTHKSGDVLRFRVYDIARSDPGRVNLAFDDQARNFEIQRPERFLKGPHAALPSASADAAEGA
jgi:hypothetical protein